MNLLAACAFGQQACILGLSSLFLSMNYFADDLTKARLEGTSQNLIRKLNKKDLLILDDFGLQPLTLEARLAYAVTKLDEFRGDAGLLCRERVHATEVLVVRILLKLRHDRLVGHIAVCFKPCSPTFRRIGFALRPLSLQYNGAKVSSQKSSS